MFLTVVILRLPYTFRGVSRLCDLARSDYRYLDIYIKLKLIELAIKQ